MRLSRKRKSSDEADELVLILREALPFGDTADFFIYCLGSGIPRKLRLGDPNDSWGAAQPGIQCFISRREVQSRGAPTGRPRQIGYWSLVREKGPRQVFRRFRSVSTTKATRGARRTSDFHDSKETARHEQCSAGREHEQDE